MRFLHQHNTPGIGSPERASEFSTPDAPGLRSVRRVAEP